MVPHQALHAERQKVRRYTEEVADFRKALAETNAAWERRMGQLVEAISPRQAQPAPPDFFDNPEAATRHEVVQTVSPEFERINQTLHSFARDQAIGRFDEGKVNGAEQAFLGALRAGQLDPADYRRVVNSPNRYAEAVRWHERQAARAEIGDDPAAFKARLEAELRDKILAELGGRNCAALCVCRRRRTSRAPATWAPAAGRPGPAPHPSTTSSIAGRTSGFAARHRARSGDPSSRCAMQAAKHPKLPNCSALWLARDAERADAVLRCLRGDDG